MPWSEEIGEGMRLKQEIRLVDPPHSLVLRNSSTRDLEDASLKIANDKVSPETLSHRLEKGWQHLQECHDTFLSSNDNNNLNNNPPDLNDNSNNLLDDKDPSVPAPGLTFSDGDYHNMSSEDSGSSSEDESSASFSDTSPLLDVSSLDNSDVSLDSDMSEDSSSTTSSSSSEAGELDDEVDNFNNNNDEEEEEDVSIMDAPSMQSSWMSFSSAASSPSVAGPSRGQIVLPDVLPVGMIPKSSDEDSVLCDNNFPPSYGPVATKITFEKRSSQEHGASRMSGDCCLVEITAQPDVQVDIRVNPVSSRPHKESRPMTIKHGNTYPREARNNKRYLKNRDISAWIVNDSFDEHYDEKTTKPWALDEGIRLNNFTIVNGQKTLSLTELVDKNTNDEVDVFQKLDSHSTTNNARVAKSCNGPFTNSYQNFERNYSKLPANMHLCCKDNWRHQKDLKNAAIKQKISTADTASAEPVVPATAHVQIDTLSTKTTSQLRTIPKDIVEKSKQIPPSRINTDSNSNKLLKSENLPTKPKKEISFSAIKKKTGDSKLSSLEMFDVYNMETALPQINWAAISKGCKESDWIRKRRNDREEIRRKLAMDSDTEDYISEKLSQHREAGGSFDRLKSTGNLQICFMNEAAKDQDLSNAEDENPSDKCKAPVPKVQNSSIHLPSAILGKTEQQAVRPPPTNNNASPSVVKRQRPKFFFNRPRSWHASKQDDLLSHQQEGEDLLARHVRLQAEAREALAQAKDMARMQMEIERQKKKKSPIADIVGLPFPDGKTLLTQHALVAMNVAQLQVIVNDLHSQIETLNEDLVKFLLERDDLHMEQDSKLVDIEDLTRYLGLKGSGSVSSSSSQVSVNSTSDSKKIPEKESVRRSQSVHLKSKNLMWPLPQLALFKENGHRA